MAKGFSLADQLFNADKVGYLAGLLGAAVPAFEAAAFQRAVMRRLPELELKARINWIAECLDAALPGRFDTLAGQVIACLPDPCDPGLGDDDFGDFIFAPLGELLVRRGLDDPERALDVLEEVTQRFSMEYAIRPFLNAHPEVVFARLAAWADHPHYHVRRLVSEGTRPRLPWGIGLQTAPERALPLLDALEGDGTRFVTRSVANHLNDLSKIMPGAVMDRLTHWERGAAQDAGELAWMRRHALRTLIKQGDTRAMKMLGYAADADVSLTRLDLERGSVALGEQLGLALELDAPRPTALLVDYVLHFHRGPGIPRTRKVMKLGQGAAAPGKPLRLTKRYRIPRDATTIRTMAGPHRLDIQVNGRVIGGVEFEVTA